MIGRTIGCIGHFVALTIATKTFKNLLFLNLNTAIDSAAAQPIISSDREAKKPRSNVHVKNLKDKKTSSKSTYENILEVSVSLFAQLGFDGVSMRAIARDAGITLPVIYHHFGNKEELYRDVEDKIYGELATNLLSQLDSEASSDERLRNFIGNLIDGLSANPNTLMLVQRDLLQSREKNQKYLVSIALQPVYDKLKTLLNSFSQGSGDGMQPILIIGMVLGLLSIEPYYTKMSGYEIAALNPDEKKSMLIEEIVSYIKASGTQS